ncbi:hypothetical protein [Streptomyces sp. NBRC 109706]|uniref:hypothetical protein n=1 Tax=Streptomyces sp. NBRC 109706 TaxID=1550035 RepID=UPI0007854EB1|nr:hypothetical protein [Streptomyces sp. NBRC 109706]
MEDELEALAGAGAAALVAAMATELWQSARGGVLALFGRAGRRRRAEVADRLDDHAALVAAAAAPDDTRRALAGSWARELEALLGREAACREPLARLVENLRGALPERGGAVSPRLDQINTVHGSGMVFAVQGGDQSVRWPPSATGPSSGPEE